MYVKSRDAIAVYTVGEIFRERRESRRGSE
jgi:hypothetical protein